MRDAQGMDTSRMHDTHMYMARRIRSCAIMYAYTSSPTDRIRDLEQQVTQAQRDVTTHVSRATSHAEMRIQQLEQALQEEKTAVQQAAKQHQQVSEETSMTQHPCESHSNLI